MEGSASRVLFVVVGKREGESEGMGGETTGEDEGSEGTAHNTLLDLRG